MTTGHRKKYYTGAIECELEAAHLYDYYVILAYGLEAKTNFSYTRDEVAQIIVLMR